MSRKKLKIFLKMIKMILDGCKDLEEAMTKIQKLIES